MSEDTKQVEQQNTTSEVVVNASEDAFKTSTGLSRYQATRVTAALLGVIGGAMPDGLNPRQQLTAAINLIGMVAAEVVAGTGGNEQQRNDLIASLNAFVTKNANELSKQYEQAAQFAQFLEQTIGEAGAAIVPEGEKPN